MPIKIPHEDGSSEIRDVETPYVKAYGRGARVIKSIPLWLAVPIFGFLCLAIGVLAGTAVSRNEIKELNARHIAELADVENLRMTALVEASEERKRRVEHNRRCLVMIKNLRVVLGYDPPLRQPDQYPVYTGFKILCYWHENPNITPGKYRSAAEECFDPRMVADLYGDASK